MAHRIQTGAILMSCILLLVICFAGCSQHPTRNSLPDDSVKTENRNEIDIQFRKDSLALRKHETNDMAASLETAGLTDARVQDSSIQVDLKYAGTDNFLGFNLYGHLNRCFLQPDVTLKLVNAQKVLRTSYPFYSLIVYDAVRPLHIQKMMWDTLKMPAGIKQQYLSSPEVVSLHNYGAAVDVSIVTRDGLILDMGTPYDFFGPLAHPGFEDRFREEGKLTIRQILNRDLLRTVMQTAGFSPIETEWWHFNSCSRQEAARLYRIIQ